MKGLVLSILTIIIIGCGNAGQEDVMGNGLGHYRKKRYINKELLPFYSLQEVAFFKNDSLDYDFVFKLSENSSADSIAKYGFGFVYFTSDGSIPEPGSLIYLMKPKLEMINGNKYIVERVTPPAAYLDSLHIFLTGRDGYTGVKGNMVLLRNIQLK